MALGFMNSSLSEMVGESQGNPARFPETPRFTASATLRSGTLHGFSSLDESAIPMIGRPSSGWEVDPQ